MSERFHKTHLENEVDFLHGNTHEPRWNFEQANFIPSADFKQDILEPKKQTRKWLKIKNNCTHNKTTTVVQFQTQSKRLSINMQRSI